MKKMPCLALLSLLVLLIGVGTGLYPVQEVQAEDHAHRETYTCPMHPEVKTHEPGNCPICHMKLVPVKEAKTESGKTAEKSVKKIKFYRNPMNPVITSPTPMQDSMGMDYLPVYESETLSSASESTGRAAFELSNEQITNLKIATKNVGRMRLTEKLAVAARVSSASTIALQVHEADSLKVKAGQAIEFQTLGSPTSYLGKIINVDNALDPMSRTLRVTGSITSRGAELKTEQSGIAQVSIDLGMGLVVPDDALIQTGHENLVYVVSGRKVSPRVIKIGARVGNFYQVLEGLTEGEEISTGPNFLLDSEARIRGIHD